MNREGSNAAALALGWTLGFNKDLVGGVHNLSNEDEGRRSLFYVAGHTGVIYDYHNRTQKLLQGHCNPISCTATSEDKRWICTSDKGSDNVLIVWDTKTATPIKTIFNPHPDGVVAMDMSPDAMFIITLSNPVEGQPQEISLWEWTVEREGPLYTAPCVSKTNQQFDLLHSVKFNPSDVRQVVTNSSSRVVFWNWENKSLTMFCPPVSNNNFRQKVGGFTSSVFLPENTQCVTATNDGDVLLWDTVLPQGKGQAKEEYANKRAVKLVKLANNNSSLDFICIQGRFFVCGSSDGAVRFFDFQFRLVAWFEDLNGGGVTSVSFSSTLPSASFSSVGKEPVFSVEDFCVGTSKALIIGIEAHVFNLILPEQRRGTLLVQGFDSHVKSLTAHPFLNRVAVCCESGAIQLWDFQTKRLVNVRVSLSVSNIPTYITFDPHGKFLAVGFIGGSLLILNADTLADVQSPLKHSPDDVQKIVFSADSSFIATCDSNNAVGIYRYITTVIEDLTKEEQSHTTEWLYIGKIISHSGPITGLKFGVSIEGFPLLASVGEDRHLVQYDLLNSSIPAGVICQSRQRIEQSAKPTACMWHPYSSSTKEQALIIANNEYKLKVVNAGSKVVRKTVLSPTYGGPLNELHLLPKRKSDELDSRYIAYSTFEKVIGLIKLDIDGNPLKSMGLIAHPSFISGITCSFDGSYVLSGGGQDNTVNIWQVNTDVIDAKEASDSDPFSSLIVGGKEGEFFQEIISYFYYAQLRAQGEASTCKREIGGNVPLQEVPNLMRALGFYPSEEEVENLINEVKYSQFTQTGVMQEKVGLQDFIRLYVNHRPVFGIGKDPLENAFDIIRKKNDLSGDLAWKGATGLSNLLIKYGETMGEDELTACITALMGDEGIPARLSALDFAEKILGFESS